MNYYDGGDATPAGVLAVINALNAAAFAEAEFPGWPQFGTRAGDYRGMSSDEPIAPLAGRIASPMEAALVQRDGPLGFVGAMLPAEERAGDVRPDDSNVRGSRSVADRDRFFSRFGTEGDFGEVMGDFGLLEDLVHGAMREAVRKWGAAR